MKRSNRKLLLKIIGILLAISIVISIVLAFLVGRNKRFITRLIDNLFIVGTAILIVSIFFSLREKAIVFANKELFKKNKEEAKKSTNKKNENNKARDKYSNPEDKIILRREIFNMLYKTLLATGFLCYLLSLIILVFS